MDHPVRTLCECVVPSVLASADPGEALARRWHLLADEPHDLAILAFGKGSAAMARVAIEHAQQRVQRGLVVARPEHVDRVPTMGGVVRVLAADHPIPTERNIRAAREVSRFVAATGAQERLVVLISGGGSAQLSSPRKPLTLAQVAALTDALLRSGATINEINCVRKHCETIKGGQLAQLAAPAPVSAFVLSDVLGDPLDVISSGPFAPDPTSFADALDVVESRGLAAAHGEVVALLRRGAAGGEEETPKPGDAVFTHVEHHVIANNACAVDAAADALRNAGFDVVEIRTGVQGEASVVGSQLGRRVCALSAGSAVVWGGETTVHVGEAPGKGGRNQELALAAAVEIDRVPGAAVLSLATDGVDGPTDAAGGVVDTESVAHMRARGVDPGEALARHDSYAALRACGGLLVLGATGTNVNDVMVGLRSPAGQE